MPLAIDYLTTAKNATKTVAFVSYFILIPVVAAVAVVTLFTIRGAGWISPFVPQLVSLGVAAILAISPLIACFVQTISVDRQFAKLDSVIIDEVKATTYFRLSKANLGLIKLKAVSITEPDFTLPMLLFSIIISFCALLSFMSLFFDHYLSEKSFILGGMHIIDNEGKRDIQNYQEGTLVAASVAFVGAYLALFRRMLDQINNNDIYPISFHYYSCWLIGAMIIAAIFRQIAGAFGVSSITDTTIILVSFGIGAAPAPFFSAFLRSAFAKMNVTGDKPDPERDKFPSNLNLLMIDGLADDRIDRLSELGVSDAQVLACQNPFTLWTRLPYDLGLIVDWISQAQLYMCLREEGLKKARGQQITDIHKFYSVLSDPKGAADFCNEVGLKPSFVPPLLASMNQNPCFVRLREVATAMLGIAPPPGFELGGPEMADKVGGSSQNAGVTGHVAAAQPALFQVNYEKSGIPDGRAAIAALIVARFADANYGDLQQLAALASAISESKLDPQARSEGNSDRWGLFQLSRNSGFSRGYSVADLTDATTSIDIIVAEAKLHPDFGAATSIEKAVYIFLTQVMRPADAEVRQAKYMGVVRSLRPN